MKKLNTLIIIIAIALGMTACGKAEGMSVPVPSAEHAVEAAETSVLPIPETTSGTEEATEETAEEATEEATEETLPTASDETVSVESLNFAGSEEEAAEIPDVSQQEQDDTEPMIQTEPSEISDGEKLPPAIVHAEGMEQEILSLINQYRAEAGAAPLTYETGVVNCAVIRAQETLESFSHTRPNGTNFTSVFEDCGVCWNFVAGENVARYFPTAQETMDALMASEAHRNNILYPDYTRVCIVALESPDYPGYYLVEQLFMGPEEA